MSPYVEVPQCFDWRQKLGHFDPGSSCLFLKKENCGWICCEQSQFQGKECSEAFSHILCKAKRKSFPLLLTHECCNVANSQYYVNVSNHPHEIQLTQTGNPRLLTYNCFKYFPLPFVQQKLPSSKKPLYMSCITVTSSNSGFSYRFL